MTILFRKSLFYFLIKIIIIVNRYSLSRLYHSLKTPVNTLVFEDLAETHFEMASREKGLDLAHSLLVMNKLGKLHATSVKLFKKVK